MKNKSALTNQESKSELKRKINFLFFVLIIAVTINSLRSQQSTTWTSVSPTVWESLSSDGLVRVEARVTAGVSILGNETMGCTSDATYGDPTPDVFGSPSLEISALPLVPGTLEFHFFDAVTDDSVYIANPLLHVDKVGTFALIPFPILGFSTTTGVFQSTNGNWTELSSNGPIFESTNTQFNIDAGSIVGGNGGECGNGISTGTGGGTMRLNDPVQSIDMDVSVTFGLLALNEEVEFVLSNLIIADPSIEVTKTVVENFSTPVSVGDDVDYTIKVENTGNVPVDNIVLTDNLRDVDNNALAIGAITYTGADSGSPQGHLEVDEIATYTVTYTLTQSEIDAGGLRNQVTANGDALFGTELVNDISDDGNDTDLNTTDDFTESFFPVAEDDTISFDEDMSTDIPVTTNDDFGGNGSSSTAITLVSIPSNGVAVINDNGTPTVPTDDLVSYTPSADFNGIDSFVYRITDSKGYASDATVNITINPIADTVDDSFSTDEDIVLNEDVSTNDSHTTAPNYILNTDGTNGSVSLATDGTFSYTPNPDFNGTDSFTYDATDINGDTETATVTITVNPIADAVDDAFSTDEDVVLNDDVSTNDTHTTATNYVVNTNPTDGILVLNTDGTFSYTPNSNFSGTDSFLYDVTDVNGEIETALVTITVFPINGGMPLVPILNIDLITADNIINESESVTAILVTGTVTGDFSNGDTVTLTINNTEYSGTVNSTGNFEIPVSGNDLVLDGDLMVSGILTTSDNFGNTGTATAQRPYEVAIDAPLVDSFTTADSSPVLTGEGSPNEALTITVDVDGDSIVDITYSTVTDSNGNWSIDTESAVPENGNYTDLPSGSTLDITATDLAGNQGTGTIMIIFDNDRDNDGLTNEEEDQLGTDPDNPDTDGDGITDGQEVIDGTDPLDPCDSNGGTPPPGAPCELYIENDLVTPSDIMNGSFQIINIDLFPDNSVDIHNRWGQLVWETKGYDNRTNAFNGISKGQIAIPENNKLPSGVYYYRIKYVANGEDKVLKGYLYINK